MDPVNIVDRAVPRDPDIARRLAEARVRMRVWNTDDARPAPARRG